MPRLGITMTKGKVTNWLKKEGDDIRKGDPLFELETEKVQTVARALDSGVLHTIVAPAGAVVPVGGLVAVLANPGEKIAEDIVTVTSQPEAEEKKPLNVESIVETPRIREKISPLARRLAEKYGIDAAKVKGTGPEGRIVKEDILREALKKPSEDMAESVNVAAEKEMSFSRKVMVEKLIQSHLKAVHVTVAAPVDMTQTIALRERLSPEIEKTTGTKPSYTGIIVKAVSFALKEYPLLNSRLEGDTIKMLADINIGVAVELEDSLVVPVVRNADQKSIAQISLYIDEKIEKARKGELSLDEVSGGTFTISNLGMFDVEIFTPIINPPESALLGVGKAIPKPWVIDNQIAVRPIAIFSLSFDHRIFPMVYSVTRGVTGGAAVLVPASVYVAADPTISPISSIAMATVHFPFLDCINAGLCLDTIYMQH